MSSSNYKCSFHNEDTVPPGFRQLKNFESQHWVVTLYECEHEKLAFQILKKTPYPLIDGKILVELIAAPDVKLFLVYDDEFLFIRLYDDETEEIIAERLFKHKN